MKTRRSRIMRLIFLVCQLGLILRTEAQIPTACITSGTNRAPENSDITVICGTQHMDLSIFLCPVYQARYNESLMVLNNELTKPECFGTADFGLTPPVLKFSFPINKSSVAVCGNNVEIIDQIGTGQFSDFSKVQFVNVSGSVISIDPSAGTITYRPQIIYKFSCLYPLQYILNNTKLGVAGVSITIKDNNGSFSSTLDMLLYKDEQYLDLLEIPQTGLNLKTKIYVAVRATNLTTRFNVLLDRCYATTSPYPGFTTYYDLFVGCTSDAQTKVALNGVSQRALFSFEAFRFVEHQDLTVSTFYLHCVTTLCEASTCATLLPNCAGARRRKREAQDAPVNATVTSTAIIVGKKNADLQTHPATHGASSEGNYSRPVVAVIVCVVILAILFIAMAVYFALYIRARKPPLQ